MESGQKVIFQSKLSNSLMFKAILFLAVVALGAGRGFSHPELAVLGLAMLSILVVLYFVAGTEESLVAGLAKSTRTFIPLFRTGMCNGEPIRFCRIESRRTSYLYSVDGPMLETWESFLPNEHQK